jgi:hypothetical protein
LRTKKDANTVSHLEKRAACRLIILGSLHH